MSWRKSAIKGGREAFPLLLPGQGWVKCMMKPIYLDYPSLYHGSKCDMLLSMKKSQEWSEVDTTSCWEPLGGGTYAGSFHIQDPLQASSTGNQYWGKHEARGTLLPSSMRDMFSASPNTILWRKKGMWITVLMGNWTFSWFFIHKIVLYKKKLFKPHNAEAHFSSKFR